MSTDGPRLANFEPEITPPPTNGTHVKRRARPLRGTIFGFLLGALLATSLVPRLQWLNLSTIGWWGRPVAAALAAGALVGAMRRDRFRHTMLAGGLAGLLSLWGVYLIVRVSVEVLFVERSFAVVLATDLARLALYGAPAGVAGAFVVWRARAGWERLRRR